MSDIHAYNKATIKDGASIPSHYEVSTPGGVNPLKALAVYLVDNNRRPQITVCAGDLVDKCDVSAMPSCWDQLNNLKQTIGADKLIVTPGNHDLDSRLSSIAHDPKAALQGLTPEFPDADQQIFNEFWSRHSTVSVHSGVRFLNINTSAYHGYGTESQHGRVSSAMLSYIRQKLESSRHDINIAVCHHPPQEQSEAGQGAGDSTHEGDDLIDLLDSGEFGQWLVIYGHKHYPKLMYSRGSGMSPVLLSCAAACAIPHTGYGKAAVNQVHLIDLDLNDIDRLGLVGVIHSLEWNIITQKWQPADDVRGLLAKTGFGLRMSPRQVALFISKWLKKNKPSKWTELVLAHPDFKYLDRNTIYSTIFELRKLKCNVEVDEKNGMPFEMQKL